MQSVNTRLTRRRFGCIIPYSICLYSSAQKRYALTPRPTIVSCFRVEINCKDANRPIQPSVDGTQLIRLAVTVIVNLR